MLSLCGREKDRKLKTCERFPFYPRFEAKLGRVGVVKSFQPIRDEIVQLWTNTSSSLESTEF